jgi:hypothetical protein
LTDLQQIPEDRVGIIVYPVDGPRVPVEADLPRTLGVVRQHSIVDLDLEVLSVPEFAGALGAWWVSVCQRRRRCKYSKHRNDEPHHGDDRQPYSPAIKTVAHISYPFTRLGQVGLTIGSAGPR